MQFPKEHQPAFTKLPPTQLQTFSSLKLFEQQRLNFSLHKASAENEKSLAPTITKKFNISAQLNFELVCEVVSYTVEPQ